MRLFIALLIFNLHFYCGLIAQSRECTDDRVLYESILNNLCQIAGKTEISGKMASDLGSNLYELLFLKDDSCVTKIEKLELILIMQYYNYFAERNITLGHAVHSHYLHWDTIPNPVKDTSKLIYVMPLAFGASRNCELIHKIANLKELKIPDLGNEIYHNYYDKLIKEIKLIAKTLKPTDSAACISYACGLLIKRLMKETDFKTRYPCLPEKRIMD